MAVNQDEEKYASNIFAQLKRNMLATFLLNNVATLLHCKLVHVPARMQQDFDLLFVLPSRAQLVTQQVGKRTSVAVIGYLTHTSRWRVTDHGQVKKTYEEP